MDHLTDEERAEFLERINKLADEFPIPSIMEATEFVRKRIGRPIAHIHDREMLNWLRENESVYTEDHGKVQR